MTWIKSDPRLSSSPKFFDLVSRLKVGPRDAFWNLHHLWYWCSDHYPDGVLKDVSDVAIAYSAKWPGEPKAFVDALVSSGFMDRSDGRLFIHDWDKWRSDPVMKRSVRHTAAVRPPRGGQEEKREGRPPAPPPFPTPLSSSSVTPTQERKEEDSATRAAAFDSKRRQNKPIQHWGVLVDHIKRRWEYKKRPNGRFAPTDKDFGQLRRRALVYDVFELMGLYDEFIVDPEPFFAKKGHSISMFCEAVDSLVDRKGWKAKAEGYRAALLKPSTPTEAENAKKVSEALTGIMAGKVSDTIKKQRETIERIGNAA